MARERRALFTTAALIGFAANSVRLGLGLGFGLGLGLGLGLGAAHVGGSHFSGRVVATRRHR